MNPLTSAATNLRPLLDEATAALDAESEGAVQQALDAVMASHGCTVIMVAHRLSTVVDAHEILVMDAGRIIERGSHAELLAANGRYASMWALQQSGE